MAIVQLVTKGSTALVGRRGCPLLATKCRITYAIPMAVVSKRNQQSFVGQASSSARIPYRSLLCGSISGSARNRNPAIAARGTSCSMTFPSPPSYAELYLSGSGGVGTLRGFRLVYPVMYGDMPIKQFVDEMNMPLGEVAGRGERGTGGGDGNLPAATQKPPRAKDTTGPTTKKKSTNSECRNQSEMHSRRQRDAGLPRLQVLRGTGQQASRHIIQVRGLRHTGVLVRR